MSRYHKKVYIPGDKIEDLISFTYKLNQMEWRYTNHCLDNLKLRALDLEQLLYWIKTDCRFDYNDIFEFYTDDKNNITKVCYRIKYNNSIDIILVLGTDKQIITIYYNSNDDDHITLKKELYINQ